MPPLLLPVPSDLFQVGHVPDHRPSRRAGYEFFRSVLHRERWDAERVGQGIDEIVDVISVDQNHLVFVWPAGFSFPGQAVLGCLWG
jgi:hypothetical protein